MAEQTDRASGPLVSIIVRTKDRPALLRQALDSIVAQSYRPIEVVVVNDGGEDASALLPTNHGLDLRYIDLGHNYGRAGAANRGVASASGQLIGFLDDDDLYFPDAIAALVREMNAREVVYGNVVLRHYEVDGTERTDIPERHFARPYSQEQLWVENYIPFNALLFRRNCFGAAGPFREDLPLCEDWEFLLRLSDRTAFHYVDHEVAIYRDFGSSTVTGSRFNPQEMEAAMDKVMSERWAKVTPRVIRTHRTLISGHYR